MSDQPILNTQLLDTVMDFINKNPEKWDQQSWVDGKYDPETEEMCGTTCCFAGHSLLFSGEWEVVVNTEYDSVEIYNIEGGRGPVWSEDAAEVLGLNSLEARLLFDGDNSRSDLLEIVQSIKDGEYR